MVAESNLFTEATNFVITPLLQILPTTLIHSLSNQPHPDAVSFNLHLIKTKRNQASTTKTQAVTHQLKWIPTIS